MEEQKVIISSSLEQSLADAVAACAPDVLLVLMDSNTLRHCWPLVSAFPCMAGARTIVIEPGDDHKDLGALTHVWQEMQRLGATRHSLLVSLGGGMVTDLGGFAASTFKRGIKLVNIPTTLLAMVDASVGGKTGINFGGLKNELGVFRNASAVILDTIFLRTLDRENILSGYAEMLKHALISDTEMLNATLDMDLVVQSSSTAASASPVLDVEMVAKSVAVKQRIVTADPMENGLRKALNLGHTAGHALESLALTRRPVLHGYAVAWGLVCELYLSAVKTHFPVGTMRRVVRHITDHYGRMPLSCDDYPVLLELMGHDKKNTAGRINFTLLSDVGQVMLDQTASKSEIEEALDFLREG